MRVYRSVAWIQWLVLTAIATYLSLISDPGPMFASVWDKWLHVICWFFLLVSLRFAWRRWPHFHWGALGLYTYSVLLEALQMLNPNRQFGLGDAAANAIGIMVGYAVAYWCYPYLERWLRAWKILP